MKAEQQRAYARKWWSQNGHRYKTVRARWYQRNKNKLRRYRSQRQNIWRHANRQHVLQYRKQWRDNNIDSRRRISIRAAEKPRARWLRSKRVAQLRGLRWTIGWAKYCKLISEPCYYCGGPLPRQSAGLDRVDNRKGYLRNNVVPCCRLCNWMKRDMTTSEFISHISKICKTFPTHLDKENGLLVSLNLQATK